MAQLSPEAIYQALGKLVGEMPELTEYPLRPETVLWIGRATALVEMVCDMATIAAFRVASQNLNGVLRFSNAQTIRIIACQALAKAEILAPTSAQGQFIPAQHPFDAFVAVAKALSNAEQDVFLLDKYADAVAINEYAKLAPEKVPVRLLAKNGRKDLLKPAFERWQQQHGRDRPLEVRLVPEHMLHDRAIFVDKKTAWMLGQSLNDLAKKSPTTLAKMPDDVARDKIAAYEALWASAQPLV